MGALVGKAIAPEVADKYIDLIEFDGIGRVQTFPKDGALAITETALRELEAAQVRPLTLVNSDAPREAPRTEREALVRLMHQLRTSGTQASRDLLVEAKALWLSAKLDGASLGGLLLKVQAQVAAEPGLSAAIGALQKDTAQPKTLAQYHDNIYGRAFESNFAHELVKNPPAGSLTAARKVGAHLLTFFDKLPDDYQYDALENVASQLREKARLWFEEAPRLMQFLADPTPAHVRALLTDVNSGFDIVTFSEVLPPLMLSMRAAEYPMVEAMDRNYNTVVLPVKQDQRSHVFRSFPETNRYGIGLSYQPPYALDGGRPRRFRHRFCGPLRLE